MGWIFEKYEWTSQTKKKMQNGNVNKM
jgi:hypothetical protein